MHDLQYGSHGFLNVWPSGLVCRAATLNEELVSKMAKGIGKVLGYRNNSLSIYWPNVGSCVVWQPDTFVLAPFINSSWVSIAFRFFVPLYNMCV